MHLRWEKAQLLTETKVAGRLVRATLSGQEPYLNISFLSHVKSCSLFKIAFITKVSFLQALH